MYVNMKAKNKNIGTLGGKQHDIVGTTRQDKQTVLRSKIHALNTVFLS